MRHEPSPFPHQGPLLPEQVVGRDELLDDLIERLTGRRVTALLGPRRFGKTSVLRRVAAELTEAGTSVVWVDLYETSSVADLARRIDRGLADARGPVRDVLGGLAAAVDLRLGLLGVQLGRRASERPEPGAVLDQLLDTLVAGARREPTVLVIDELPGIERVEGAAGLLRTKLQHHVQEIGLAFAGSQPSLMRAMFTRRDRPFYAQADLVEVGPLTAAALREAVARGFAGTGRACGDLPERIYDLTGGHPYRSMQVADAAWRVVVPGAEAADTAWADAVELVRAETNLACEAVFTGLTAGEQATLRLVAHGDALFGARAELLGVSTGSVRHALRTLVEAGDLTEASARARFVDPLMADWVRRRFPR